MPTATQVIERALAAGVERMLAIGTGNGPPDLEAGIRLAERHAAFYATVGVHPHDAAKATPDRFAAPGTICSRIPKVLAVGEIGLDYHYDFSPRDMQKSIFIEQLSIAAAARKPIVIHTREAWDDTLALIEQYWTPHGLRGIMHCFTGGPAEAARALDLGFYLSFGGVVTFPKAPTLQAAARIRPARPPPGRDRRALSRASAASRQTQRAGLDGRHGAQAGGSARRELRTNQRRDDRKFPPPHCNASARPAKHLQELFINLVN